MVLEIQNLNESSLNAQIIKLIEQFNIEDNEKILIVVPDKISSIFINEEFKSIGNLNFTILSIDDYIQELTNLKLAQEIDLIHLLFKIKVRIIPEYDDFENFYNYGKAILNDFNEIDANLVDPAKFFSNIKVHNQIDILTYNYDQNKNNFIKEFYLYFINKENFNHKKYLNYHNYLLDIYDKFNTYFISTKRVYKGFIYKKLNKNLDNNTINTYFSKFVFVGFSSLSKIEYKLFSYLKSNYKIKFLGNANMFCKNINNSKEKSISFNRETKIDLDKNKKKRINLYKSITDEEQIKIIISLIIKIKESHSLNNSGIIRPDRSLLKILISNLSKSKIDYIIENHLLLHFSDIYIFFNKIIRLQSLLNKNNNYDNIMIKFLIKEISCHKIFKNINSETSTLILNKNIPIINSLLLVINNLKESKIDINIQIFERVLFKLKIIYTKDIKASDEFLDCFNKIFIETKKNETDNLILKKNAIKIIDIEQATCLDFDNLFILSANENTFPLIKKNNSIFSKNILKSYGLYNGNLGDEYHNHLFFNLVKRSKTINICYKANDVELGPIEPSRYILQILNSEDFNVNLFESNTQNDLSSLQNNKNSKIQKCDSKDIIIEKNDIIFKQIQNVLSTNSISAKAINTYIDCQLKFYFKYIKKINAKLDEQNENILFGKLVHKVIELFYIHSNINLKEHITDYLISEKYITQQILQLRKLKVDDIIEKAFVDLNLGNINTIQNNFENKNIPIYIFKKIIKKILNQIIKIDENFTPFKVIGIELGKEESLQTKIKVNGLVINLRGVIDRVDFKEDTIRIIDYKTGNYDLKINNIKNLFDRNDQKRNSIALQIFLYSYIFRNYIENDKLYIKPIVIGIKEIFKKNDNFIFQIKENGNYIGINNFNFYHKEFKLELIKVFEELLNKEVPFEQCSNLKICQNCEFKKICNK
ncbi:MAG: PD-(D/E)XK nuclease family protein [Bacteroidetes bacterium]|nr:PD-(D/E)XK nuclease family protein [Bacteroidota bacterium]